jgi:hypothetical protein
MSNGITVEPTENDAWEEIEIFHTYEEEGADTQVLLCQSVGGGEMEAVAFHPDRIPALIAALVDEQMAWKRHENSKIRRDVPTGGEA